MVKVKGKDSVFKTATERQLVTYKRVPINLPADFSTETFQTKKKLSQNSYHKTCFSSDEKRGPTTKTNLPSRVIIYN